MAPNKLGITSFENYDLNRLIPYIDWKPFFDVWQLRGKYPNRGYPKIFNDEDVGKPLVIKPNKTVLINFFLIGPEARRVFDDAQTLLQQVSKDGLLQAHGIVGLYRAQRVGDDVQILGDDDSVMATLFGLRQQVSYTQTHT